ncbi:MAG: HD-GYP domain-containing protein [Acidimicrobiales bacterium]
MDQMIATHLRLLPALHNAETAFDPGTARHSWRVGYTVAVIGEGLELPPDDIELLSWTGVLHDLGKLSLREELLCNQAFLNATELAEVQRHPRAGADTIRALCPEMAEIADGIRGHHERWDGSGYPDGLCGQEIPLFSRIIALADVFDAVTHRTGRRAEVMTHAAAVHHVILGAGTQFDPHLVGLFFDLDQRGLIGTRERELGSELRRSEHPRSEHPRSEHPRPEHPRPEHTRPEHPLSQRRHRSGAFQSAETA